jgi:uncharacterized protein with HEPN domain
MSERAWQLYLDDMIVFCERVLSYTEGYEQTQFENTGLTYDATVRNIELIGEAATHIPDSIRAQAPYIVWRQVIAACNRLIHGYSGIDNDTLWSMIQDDVPVLLDDLQRFKLTLSEHQKT